MYFIAQSIIMPYSIDHFFSDDSIETVPEHWIDKKNGTCAWPYKSKTASRLIEKKCMPNEIEYTYLKCRELYKGIGKYNKIPNNFSGSSDFLISLFCILFL